MLRRTCPLILSFCSKYRPLYIVGSSFLLLYGYSLYSMSEMLPLCLLWLLFEMYWALGIQLRFTRKRCPTDHAIIERTHQTMTPQALLGHTSPRQPQRRIPS